MVKFDDVKNVSTEEYFRGNQFSIDAFNKKYSQTRNGKSETYVESLKRVCDYIASAESSKEDQEYWSARWFDEIYNDMWHPAGSIMQGADSGKNVSMANCTTISAGVRDDENEWDSLESIIKNTAYTVAKTAAYRQGLGVDFSRIRPKGLNVLNSSNESSGAIHWMKFIDSIGNYIGQKGRIPAMLFSININHPDVEEFIQVKSDYTKIQNANISVQITNDFMEAVKADGTWDLTFEIPGRSAGDRVYVDKHSIDSDSIQDESGNWYYIAKKDRASESIKRTVNAKGLLELLAKNMTANAEPGIQFIDMARYWSNSDYVYDENSEYDTRILSTNACSEQYLSRESLCVLASINCGAFPITKDEYLPLLEKVSYSVNRFLDNVNEMEYRDNTYATPHQKMAIRNLRRTGAGITNIAAWLFKLNLEYGSIEANDAIADFNERYNYFLYKSSIELGRLKGSFDAFDAAKYNESPFIKNLAAKGLVFDAMRNVTCSSIAPTGTLSLMFRDFIMSYGVEPAFGMYFWKRTRISGEYQYYFCVPSVVKEYYKANGFEIEMDADTIKDTWDGAKGRKIAAFIDSHKDELSIKFKNATQVPVLEKLDLMAKLMKDVDSSISVTYTLPENADWKESYDLIINAYDRGVKSIAAFPDKKMYGIISFIPFKDLAFKLKSEGVSFYPGNFTTEEFAELHIQTPTNEQKITGNASKRETTLDADVYVVTSKGKKHIIVIGIQDNKLYEMFGGVLKDQNLFKFTHKKGTISKVKQGHYTLEIDDTITISDFGEYFTPTEQILFRMVSTSLRHGVPVKFIVEQLSKGSEDISTLSSVAARVLKKYIKDGEKVSNGAKCPSCGSTELVYGDGCVSCNCGWSRCS